MKFDRKKFFDGYRREFGALTQQQVDGLSFLLDGFEWDAYLTDIRFPSYMLATAKHETADTFQPIHEYGSHQYFVRRYGSQTKVGKQLGNDTPEEGAIYAGRGDVQLTGETNYEKAEDALRSEYPGLISQWELVNGRKFDLTVGDQPNDERDPDNAMDPKIAYAIMSHGMRTGMFTGRKLSDFFNEKRTDRKNARRIINGLDHADLIAGYANQFEQILRSAELAEDPTTAVSGQPQQGERTNEKLTLPSDQSSTAQPSTTEVKVTEQTPTVTTEVTSSPGHAPDVPAQQISQNGGFINKLFTGSAAASIGGAVLTWATGHIDGTAVIAICFTVLALAVIFHKTITDYVRMQTAADPNKYNVK